MLKRCPFSLSAVPTDGRTPVPDGLLPVQAIHSRRSFRLRGSVVRPEILSEQFFGSIRNAGRAIAALCYPVEQANIATAHLGLRLTVGSHPVLDRARRHC